MSIKGGSGGCKSSSVRILLLFLTLQIGNSATIWRPLGFAIDGNSAGAQIGRSVSISDDGTRIAFYEQSDSAFRVHVHEFGTNGWTQIANTITSTFSPGVALSGNGNRLAIGAGRGGNVSQADAGQATVYELSGSTWEPVGGPIDGEGPNDSLRYVDLNYDGSVFAAGAPWNTGSHESGGHVRVFRFENSQWRQIGQDLDGQQNNEYFSVPSVSASGLRIAIGGWGNDFNGRVNAGVTRVFELSDDAWIQLGSDIHGIASDDRYSNCRLSDNGDYLAILGNSNGGHVELFQLVNGNWHAFPSSLLPEQPNGEQLSSVDISGDGLRVAIGSSSNDGNGIDAGNVRVFEHAVTNWNQLGGDIDGESSGAESGSSVALNARGDLLATGAPFSGASVVSSGRIRVFTASPIQPALELGRAVFVESGNLQVGMTYQLQTSTNLMDWQNEGVAFTATNSVWESAEYWKTIGTNRLNFRLIIP